MGHVQETEEIEDVDTFDDFEIVSDYIDEILKDFKPIEDQMKDKIKKEEIK